EDVAVAVADRLENVWAAWTEAAEAIRAAVPASVAEECLASRRLTTHCFAGEEGQAAAQKEAARILEESGGDAGGASKLAAELLDQTPLAPPDEELRSRFPV